MTLHVHVDRLEWLFRITNPTPSASLVKAYTQVYDSATVVKTSGVLTVANAQSGATVALDAITLTRELTAAECASATGVNTLASPVNIGCRCSTPGSTMVEVVSSGN